MSRNLPLQIRSCFTNITILKCFAGITAFEQKGSSDMTAEIAIVNKHSIALAADSAMTVGRDRVWNTANKLFALGPNNDIAIMVYGSSEHVGFGWELIIKLFREKSRDQRYNTIKDCADEFIKFVYSNRFRKKNSEKLHTLYVISELFKIIKIGLTNLDLRFSKKNVLNYIKSYYKYDLISFKNIDTAQYDEFLEDLEIEIENLYKDIFGLKTVGREIVESLCKFIFWFLKSDIPSDIYSGIVIAGFGYDEINPHVRAYIFDGISDYYQKIIPLVEFNLNDDSYISPKIMSFAQSDIIKLIMEGISGDYIQFIESYFKEIIDERSSSIINKYVSEQEKIVEIEIQRRENIKIMENFLKIFNKYRQEKLINPILKVVNALPREEMAAMAEAMIEITSLRRRIDSKTESVGGPVDVAVISKGDGVIWVKRKHYFDIALNQDFLYRKHMSGRER